MARKEAKPAYNPAGNEVYCALIRSAWKSHQKDTVSARNVNNISRKVIGIFGNNVPWINEVRLKSFGHKKCGEAIGLLVC